MTSARVVIMLTRASMIDPQRRVQNAGQVPVATVRRGGDWIISRDFCL
jgi:hypothetical protein